MLYPDFKGNFRRKHLGSVRVGAKGPDDLKTLQHLRFMIGDFMCLAIVQPKEPSTHIGSGDKNYQRKNDTQQDER